MKNVVVDSSGTIRRRVPLWLLLGALGCVAVGALIPLRSSKPRISARLEPQPASTDQSAEIDRLKQAVNVLDQRSTALAMAVASPERAVAQAAASQEPAKSPAEVADTRSPEEIHRDEITALEVRFESEKDGSRESLSAARTMQTELAAAPIGGARISEVECSTSLCRATLEQAIGAKPLDMAALIQATPTVRQESMFDYTEEGSVKRVTIYSARPGHKLVAADGDGAPGAAP